MKKKIRVGILFGGKSTEHEISLLSAKNIIAALDRNKYEPVFIGIDKTGQWLLLDQAKCLLSGGRVTIPKNHTPHVTMSPQGGGKIDMVNKKPENRIDVIFPVLHGTFGEDGAIQGLLKIADIPFVGAGILGSAVGMDKDITKRLLRDAHIAVGKFLVYKKYEMGHIAFDTIQKRLGLPFFIKPANQGSSVGVSKIHKQKEFASAVKKAFTYDTKIMVEENIRGREIECSVMGNEQPVASLPGEIIPKHEFYSYDAKYIDPNGAILKIPADLPKVMIKKIQRIAVQTYKTLSCEGMARVDFFLTKDNKIFVNELNTIPGFTQISMYPKLWEASGVSPTQLIDTLIRLAIDRFDKEQKLKTSFVG
ncbi:D-alanine--D-alanine ligase A [Candidatus Uhrbacteria bacterium RIFCSPLOWO2_02_FULL_51_9]|uniref:D-alanine--D-alanine ligase n=1 Tax=Candidatus Uhrbacteria bacterium RIFCSPLOWO2_02_FULL_51_9 TaxID=1802410 RepID=A0A1F7VDT2_9BACT|nr:MAG: D-alanine--D-alanine ligase A [Candidatus Uhrbacteria bacterium RIFCSPLOWO2_02_FULL_51_9]